MKATCVIVALILAVAYAVSAEVKPMPPLKIPEQWQAKPTPPPSHRVEVATGNLIDPIGVGSVGTSCGQRLRVLQVTGPQSMRAEIYVEVYERPDQASILEALRRMPPDKADAYLKNPPPPRKGSKPKEVLIDGISTVGAADGENMDCNVKLKVTGTKSYKTAIGATRTLFLLEPVTP